MITHMIPFIGLLLFLFFDENCGEYVPEDTISYMVVNIQLDQPELT